MPTTKLTNPQVVGLPLSAASRKVSLRRGYAVVRIAKEGDCGTTFYLAVPHPVAVAINAADVVLAAATFDPIPKQ